MESKPDPKILGDFLINRMDEILTELDKKVALTKEKHFVLIQCTDAKDFDKHLKGTAYNFTFYKLSDPGIKVLSLEAREAIQNTRLNNDVGFVIIDPNDQITVMNYKRNKIN